MTRPPEHQDDDDRETDKDDGLATIERPADDPQTRPAIDPENP
jgi:hypothetical protein